ncbi:MAG: hypothetical protein QOI59_2640 [Gammaproteobacteria bacterium]|nr:hypothetical protein [Gammaproteobacteria bacterium]
MSQNDKTQHGSFSEGNETSVAHRHLKVDGLRRPDDRHLNLLGRLRGDRWELMASSVMGAPNDKGAAAGRHARLVDHGDPGGLGQNHLAVALLCNPAPTPSHRSHRQALHIRPRHHSRPHHRHRSSCHRHSQTLRNQP